MVNRPPKTCDFASSRVFLQARYAIRVMVALTGAVALMEPALAETWILPTDSVWKPDQVTFSKMANEVEAAFHRAASEEKRTVEAWNTYTIQYYGRFSDEGVRLLVVTGMCEAQMQMISDRFDLKKQSVGIADGGVCIFSAFYDADQQTLQSFNFHGEA
jgi:hypothetical protein